MTTKEVKAQSRSTYQETQEIRRAIQNYKLRLERQALADAKAEVQWPQFGHDWR